MAFSMILTIVCVLLFLYIMKCKYREYIRGCSVSDAMEDVKDNVTKKQIRKLYKENN